MNSNNVIRDAAMKPSRAEPVKLLKRIGSTTYEVTIHFSDNGKDTMADIVRRIIEREADRDG